MALMAPETLTESLRQVRAACPLQRCELHGHTWEYLAAGAGPLLLVLPGGLAVAETAFRWLATLAPRWHVVAPTYPATVSSLAELVAGLWALVDHLGCGAVCVVGGSFSGLVAQCFVRAQPERVRRLVLSDTGGPWAARLWQHQAYAQLIRLLPMALVRWLFRQGMRLFLAPLCSERDFWRTHFFANIRQLDKQRCLSHLALWAEFDQRCRFTPDDLRDWSGRILIIAADSDGLFPPQQQQALLHLYPQARPYVFANSPHCASLAQIDTYIAVAAAFLELEV